MTRGERLLTPSKITAWLDCAHYLTLRDLADRGELVATNEGMGSFARLLLDKGLEPRADGRRAFRAALVALGAVYDE